MKRSDLAEIFYRYNTDPEKLEEVGKYFAKSISESISLMFALDPEGCKDLLKQLKEQLTDEVLEEQIARFKKGKDHFIDAQMRNLNLGPHLVFDLEEDPNTQKSEENPEKVTESFGK